MTLTEQQKLIDDFFLGNVDIVHIRYVGEWLTDLSQVYSAVFIEYGQYYGIDWKETRHKSVIRSSIYLSKIKTQRFSEPRMFV